MLQSGKMFWSIRNGTYRKTRGTRRAERTLGTTSTLITDNRSVRMQIIDVSFKILD